MAGLTPQETDLLFWLIARATGIAAFVALAIALVTGIALRSALLTGLATNRIVRECHVFSTALWIPLGLAHLGALLVDRTARIGVLDLFVPFGIDYGEGAGRLAIGLGTIAFDLFVIVAVSSWIRRRMSQPLWIWIHRSSYLAFGLTFAHAVMSGTDFSQPLVSAVTWSLGAALAIFAAARVVWGRLGA